MKISKKEARQVFITAKKVIENDSLLFNSENTRFQFDTWVDGVEETYTISIITFGGDVFSFSPAWGENENGHMFDIKDQSVSNLIERMQYAMAIDTL